MILDRLEGQYNVLLIDPPWSYKNKRMGGSFKSGSSQKYRTMELEEIKKLPINSITENNAVIFMWATVPLLPEAFEVIKEWKLKYKTSIFWNKIDFYGTGWWFRGNVEILLVCIKGKIMAFRNQEKNIIEVKPFAHSEKPIEFKRLIERSTINIPNRKMLEMFARRSYSDNWDYWGDEVKSLKSL